MLLCDGAEQDRTPSTRLGSVGASYHHDVIGRVSGCPACAPSLLALALDLALLVLLEQDPCCVDVLQNALLFNHFVRVESVVAEIGLALCEWSLLWPLLSCSDLMHTCCCSITLCEWRMLWQKLALALAWLEAAKVEFG